MSPEIDTLTKAVASVIGTTDALELKVGEKAVAVLIDYDAYMELRAAVDVLSRSCAGDQWRRHAHGGVVRRG